VIIGLKRGKVELAEHRTEWSAFFEREKELILDCIGNRISDIQHVGSTAVKGLLAKPIIDIALAAADYSAIQGIADQLVREAGYIDRGDQGREGGYLLVKECEPEVRTVHLHMVAENGGQWRNYLLFRDTLISDSAIRQAYADLKQELCKTYRNDRLKYTESKHEFICKVIAGNR
jgi:GrpB-like predicted nucleotidyltransferase (UPF0157 family)